MCYEGKHVAFFNKEDDVIRHENCSIFVRSHQLRCATCSEYRQTLNRMSYRALHQADNNRISSSDPKSHTNYRYLQSSQKDERLTQLHNQARVDQQKIERLKMRIQKLVEERSVAIDEDINEELRDIILEKTSLISDTYPEGSFARLFWQNQEKCMSLKDR